MPTRRRWLIPFGLVAAVIAAVTPGLPASAEESQKVKLSAGFPNMTFAPGGAERSTGIYLWADVKEETKLQNFRFQIDSAELNGVATVGTFGDMGCATSGTIKTCESFYDPTVASTAAGVDIIYVRPVDGAKVGQQGTVKLTVSADNAIPATVTSTITIGEPVDLANAADVTVESQPGGSVTAPLAVRNVGETSVRGVELLIFQDYAAKLAKRYSNCEYSDEDAICHFDTTLAPGVEYTLSEPLSILVGKDAWAPGQMQNETMWLTPADLDTWFSGIPVEKRTPGTSGKLTLKSGQSAARSRGLNQTDPNENDNWGVITVKVTGDNKADFAALGDTARGEVGTVVTVKAGVKNLGPASANYRSGDPVQMVQIDVPAGTTAVSVPKDCTPYEDDRMVHDRRGQPGGTRYWCGTHWRFLAGETSSWTFGLRIDKKLENATSTVTININYMDPTDPRHDINSTNDTASIVINPVGNSTAGAGILPVTGGRIGALVGTAAALLTIGAVVFVLGRRRRTRFVADV